MSTNEVAEAMKARIERCYADYLRAPNAAKAQVLNRDAARLNREFGWIMDAGKWVKV